MTHRYTVYYVDEHLLPPRRPVIQRVESVAEFGSDFDTARREAVTHWRSVRRRAGLELEVLRNMSEKDFDEAATADD